MIISSYILKNSKNSMNENEKLNQREIAFLISKVEEDDEYVLLKKLDKLLKNVNNEKRRNKTIGVGI